MIGSGANILPKVKIGDNSRVELDQLLLKHKIKYNCIGRSKKDNSSKKINLRFKLDFLFFLLFFLLLFHHHIFLRYHSSFYY